MNTEFSREALVERFDRAVTRDQLFAMLADVLAGPAAEVGLTVRSGGDQVGLHRRRKNGDVLKGTDMMILWRGDDIIVGDAKTFGNSVRPFYVAVKGWPQARTFAMPADACLAVLKAIEEKLNS